MYDFVDEVEDGGDREDLESVGVNEYLFLHTVIFDWTLDKFVRGTWIFGWFGVMWDWWWLWWDFWEDEWKVIVEGELNIGEESRGRGLCVEGGISNGEIGGW